MRKSLLKTIVATAVVGATMALTSVAAMAAEYKWVPGADSKVTAADAPAVFGLVHNGALISSSSSDITGEFSEAIFDDGSKTINGKYGLNPNKEALTYIENGAVSSGKSKKFSIVTPTESGTMYVYVGRIGTGEKTGTFRIEPAEIQTVEGTTGYAFPLSEDKALASQETSFKQNDTVILSFEAEAGKSYAFYSNHDKNVVYGLKLVTSDTEEETLTPGVYDNTAKTGKVVVVADASQPAPSVYVVATVAAKDLTTGDKLIVNFNDKNKTTVETDTVYEAVNGVDTANFGGDYYYAVKIEGVSKNADVEQLKAFTFAIVSDIA